MQEREFDEAFDRALSAELDGRTAGGSGKALAWALANARPADDAAVRRARARWDGIAKPLGGLGLLEDAVCRMAGAQRTDEVMARPRAVAVFFADNGVVAQGVTQSGQEVTATVARNMAAGTTSVCRMAQAADCAVVPVDVGMAVDVDAPRVRRAKARYGTGDITRGPATTREEALAAVETGISCARACVAAGARLLAAGEMGIGNTTTSAAVASALTGAAPELTVGRGAGLTSEGLARKRAVVERALRVNQVDACADAVDVLAAVGGLDIAAMCGLYLGAAAHGCPAVLDGVISCTAALAAVRVAPELSGYLVASHCSSEPAARLLLDELGLCAPLQAGMHLGEGTGAMALLPLLDMALAVYDEAASFDACGMDAYRELS